LIETGEAEAGTNAMASATKTSMDIKVITVPP